MQIDLDDDGRLPEPLRSLAVLALLLFMSALFSLYTALLLMSWAVRHLVPTRFTKRVWAVVAMEDAP